MKRFGETMSLDADEYNSLPENAKKIIVLLLIICCMVFCLSGCGFEETENSSESLVREKEMIEAEKIESVYHDGTEMTFCIFTSNGNNGTGFLCEEKYVITMNLIIWVSLFRSTKLKSRLKQTACKGILFLKEINTER